MATIIRVSLQGALPNGEKWSVNPVYRLGTGLGATVSAAQCTTIALAINAIVIPTGVRLMQSSSTTNTGVRVEAREMNGDLDSLAEVNRATAIAGTGAQGHPFQTSMVSSLRTGIAGPRGRGRLYWPATGVTMVTSSLRVANNDVVSYLSGVKTYLSSINAAIETTLGGTALGVWSRAAVETYAVNQIQMGDVCDVQRRRRDTLIEAISAVTFP